MSELERRFEFECCRSGNCCSRPDGRVRATRDEVPGLARAAGLSVEGFTSRYLTPGPNGDWLVKMAPGGACPFLAREHGLATCTVYDARPEHCRSFPFWPEIEAGGEILAMVARFCPGLRARE